MPKIMRMAAPACVAAGFLAIAAAEALQADTDPERHVLFFRPGTTPAELAGKVASDRTRLIGFGAVPGSVVVHSTLDRRAAQRSTGAWLALPGDLSPLCTRRDGDAA